MTPRCVYYECRGLVHRLLHLVINTLVARTRRKRLIWPEAISRKKVAFCFFLSGDYAETSCSHPLIASIGNLHNPLVCTIKLSPKQGFFFKVWMNPYLKNGTFSYLLEWGLLEGLYIINPFQYMGLGFRV